MIQSLEFTLGLDTTTIRKFDVFRKKRNRNDYERADTIADTEAAEMREFAEGLRSSVEAWVSKNYPHLLA